MPKQSPAGIKQEYEKLLKHKQNTLAVEHQMMDCLAGILWEAQRNGTPPDETIYLSLLKNLN